jgi:hypothetical protein
MDEIFCPPKMPEELRDLVKKGKGLDPFREFSEVAREELRAFSQ